MATADLTSAEILELRKRYEAGSLSPAGSNAFEQEFPHLVPKRVSKDPLSVHPLAAHQAMRQGFPTSDQDLMDLLYGTKAPLLAPFAAIPDLPSREPPTLSQSGAEMAGGTAGGFAGTLLGPFGKVAGSGLGTFGAGKLAGRGTYDAAIDAAESMVFEWAGGRVASRLRQGFVPSLAEPDIQALRSPANLSEAPASLIERDLRRESMAPVGREIQGPSGLQGNIAEIDAKVKRLYKPVTDRTAPIDIQPEMSHAAALGITLPRMGAEITSGQVSFDGAMKIRSLLRSQIRELRSRVPGGGDKIKAAALAEVEDALGTKMQGAADAAGVGRQYKVADRFFRTEFAERFYQDYIHDLAEMSAERLVPSLQKASLDEARQFVVAMSRLGGKATESLPAARSGIVANLFKRAQNKGTGVIEPHLLLNQLSAIDPEVLTVLVGQDVANGLVNFAQNYAKSLARVSTGVAAGGAAAVGTGLGVTAGGAAVVGTIEAANELNFLGRVVVRRPAVMRALSAAVLTGKDEALRKVGMAGLLRIGTTQAAAQGAMQLGIQPPDLRQIVEQGFARLTGQTAPFAPPEVR